MTGLERNISTLFDEKGKLFLAAFDHPQIYGAVEGLIKPYEAIEKILKSKIDGYILNPGIMAGVCAKKVRNKKMVLRASVGGTMMGTGFSDLHSIISSPKQAVNLGADAILIMMSLGGDSDKESMTLVAKTIDEFHELSIPVIVEVLAADYTKNNDTEFVRNGVRVAAEMGADIIKAFYCKDYKSVVEACPVPIILAGGPKDQDIKEVAREVVEAGVVGFAFGRNIFQSEDPVTLINDLDKILKG